MRYPLVRSENDRVWQNYCGFLDMSITQFMSVQEALLLQQLQRVARSKLGEKILGKRTPASIEEFRRLVPLTTYQDYLPELEEGNEDSLPEKPCVWAMTSGSSTTSKRVPYSSEAYNRSLDSLMTAMILACSPGRGRSSLQEGDRVLHNVAPKPYLSGILAGGGNDNFGLKAVIPPDLHDNMDFKDKVTKGFEVSLRTGVDVLIAMTSVLVKTGSDFNRMSRRSNISRHMLHPAEAARLGRAYMKARMEKRRMLPKDLWKLKALIGWGIDTSLYREEVYKYWGAYPHEFHACTEAGIMAVQSWTRRGLTFIPHSNFYEFIPESEWLRSRSDMTYQPSTVLLSEVESGARYEIVITGFYGMPFVRYRLGHLVRINALVDEDAKIYLPQMVFESRADDLIDIAGFTRISEKAVCEAIINSGIEFEDWTIRKEFEAEKPVLHLYIELNQDYQQADLASIIHSELMKIDSYYKDMSLMLELHPMKVTILRPGTYQEFYNERQLAGAELAQRRPPRMNASDEVISELTGVVDRNTAAAGGGGA